MGILCIKQYQIIDKIECDKCGDYYVPSYGRYSQRNSCRVHHFKDGICKICHNDKNYNGNCYHYNYGFNSLCC